jgi:hypothetical protein
VRTIEPMRLTVQVPVVGLVTERGFRGRYTYMTSLTSLPAMVHGIRRMPTKDHAGKQFKFMALAYINPAYRSEIPKRNFVNDEYAWVQCLYAMNCNPKSTSAAAVQLLEEFRSSTDYQWLAADAPMPAEKGDAA